MFNACIYSLYTLFLQQDLTILPYNPIHLTHDDKVNFYYMFMQKYFL